LVERWAAGKEHLLAGMLVRMMVEKTVGRKERKSVEMTVKRLGMNWAGQTGFAMLASVLAAMTAASMATNLVETMGTNLARALAVPKDVVLVELMVPQTVERWVAERERWSVHLEVAWLVVWLVGMKETPLAFVLVEPKVDSLAARLGTQ
jgi:hypothetical protein